jgi:PAS domain S-box-containing protein
MQTKAQRKIIVLIIALLMAGIFVADLFAPRGISDWVWYFIPLMLLVSVRNTFSPFWFAGIVTILIPIGYFVSGNGSNPSWVPSISRLMAICVFWLVAWALARLQQTEERLREQSGLLNLAHDAILVRDLDDRIVFWNKSAERIYGWTMPEAVGKQAVELLLGQADERFIQAKKVVVEKGDWSGEIICRTKDGRDVVMDARWTLVRDYDGKPKSILSISSDITEKQKLQQQLFHAQRLESIGTLAGGIAHDLNNILAPVMMAMAMLREKAKEDKDTQTLLASLETNVRRGADIVKQVLAFGRGAGGERIAINPAKVIREIEKIVLETFPKSVRFESRIAPDVWTITGDTTQLHQVLLNLCLNARDAMPNGGNLCVQMENTVLDEMYANMHLEAKIGPHVVIKVMDTGTGIPPELQAKIFEPFFTTKEPGKGTGLGLSSVLAIVKSHGGFINCYSEVGKGTTFKIYLPTNTTPQAAEAVAIEQTKLPRGQNELVLVVDDEQPIRDIAKKVLERFGYRVLLAEHGAEAISLYAQHKSDIAVVITDMAMPVMDGVATIIALKAMNPAVKIIGSSGLMSNGNVAKAVDQGVQHFIPKPYTAEAMLLKLDEVLHKNPPA